MKILFVTNNYPSRKHPYFGVFVKEQRASLVKRGHHVDVFFMNSRDEGYGAYIKGLICLMFKSLSSYDVVHTHHTLSALVFILARPFIKVKIVHSYQNDPKHEFGRLTLVHMLIRIRYDVIINKAVTNFNELPKVEYLPNGVDQSLFCPREKAKCRNQLGLKKDAVYILFVDSYIRRSQKRYDRFEEVMKLAREKNIDIRPLLAIGVNREEMPLYISAADIHLITSDFEGSPNSVKEALSCGIRVVSTPVGDIPYAYKDLNAVKVSKSFESNELASLVLQCLTENVIVSENLIHKLGLTQENIAKKLEIIYERIVSKN